MYGDYVTVDTARPARHADGYGSYANAVLA